MVTSHAGKSWSQAVVRDNQQIKYYTHGNFVKQPTCILSPIFPANRQSFNLKKHPPFSLLPLVNSLAPTLFLISPPNSWIISLLNLKSLSYFLPLFCFGSHRNIISLVTNLLSHTPPSWIFYHKQFSSTRQRSPVWWVKNNFVFFVQISDSLFSN